MSDSVPNIINQDPTEYFQNALRNGRLPAKQGLYDPRNEHDNCGVGFIAHIKGERSRQILDDADRMLQHMEHRGGCGCEENTGDGAGMLTALPYELLEKVATADLGKELPARGSYAAGVVFMPTDPDEREACRTILNAKIEAQGQTLIGWREMPVDADAADIGPTARLCMPHFEMLFVGASEGLDQEAFERQLFVICKWASREIRVESKLEQKLMFYVSSLSTRIIIWKGMLRSMQVIPFFKDLQDPDYHSHLAMVHSRFSTNTFPSWDRAQPCRFMAHNGEINTLRGNANWMTARQGVMQSELWGEDLRKLCPIIEPECSDSGNFDNALEFLYHSGRTLQESVMMMIPEAWQNHRTMSKEKQAFYEFHSTLQEPWDGPASVSFTDGKYIGAVLDRNGLRPSRYYVTHDDRVIMASEVGVVEVDPANVKAKGRLQPGKMFLVDFEAGRIIADDELKSSVAAQRPYDQWLKNQRIHLSDLPVSSIPDQYSQAELLKRMQAFGFTVETLQFILMPMLREARDPIGSMGNDAALACLSDHARLTYDYFKQLFAQVTNPAIDSIREDIIMSLECYIGPEGNLLDTTEAQANRLCVPHPILSDEELASIKSLDGSGSGTLDGWKTQTVDITYARADGAGGLQPAIERVCDEVVQAINDGYKLVVLSDRAICAERVPISSLLATGAVHHSLVRQELRTRIGIVLETGEGREVHHFCLLAGYGADAVNPYVAFQALRQARVDGLLEEEYSDEKIVPAFRKAVAKGMLKVMGKMGISTLQSYKGAQIFEAVGLNADVMERCFRGTASRISGVGFDVLSEEGIRRHEIGFPTRDTGRLPVLPNDGQFHWRKGGEAHAWNPYTISEIQQAARAGDKGAYKRFSSLVNDHNNKACFLRGLLQFKDRTPVPLEEVESAQDIVKRFCTGAMSYGSISADAHETLAVAMNVLGGKSNTGEGGEDYARFTPYERPEDEHNKMLDTVRQYDPEKAAASENSYSKRSYIKQVASGRFGVTSFYLTNADELQIKVAQGAKPGEGGELPGYKVNKIIAATRHSTPGVGLISPPPHHDIYSIEDLAQLIFDLKNANPSAAVSVKLVSEVGVGTIAAGVAKGHADKILISGADGGTGASPLTSIKYAGLPWELGIAETHQVLVMNDLRSRVRLETDGQIKTGRDVVMAALLGAEEFGFATAPLITMGCIMMRKCHLNTCPVGIATQDPELRKKFKGKPEHVVNYLFMVAEEAREIMASLGFRTINEMVGRVDALKIDAAVDHWKAQGIDLTPILTPAMKPHENVGTYCQVAQKHGLEDVLDNQLIAKSAAALQPQPERVEFEMQVQNIDRAFGTWLSHEVSKAHGERGLSDDTIHINASGSAGQSIGAWLAPGITIELEGDANDYAGKGLSGGRLIVYPPKSSTFAAEENMIIGNVALYGATEGEAFFRGMSAERFCVRNSGAHAVIEGVGDHACEYMTGGRVVVLGSTGRNFAAGMSGGVAYVLAEDKEQLRLNCNLGLVDLEPVESTEDIDELKTLIQKHSNYTGSRVADVILNSWDESLTKFVKIMPRDYKRALAEMAQEEAAAVVN
jgi:glutamate synthase (NADPH) large chain